MQTRNFLVLFFLCATISLSACQKTKSAAQSKSADSSESGEASSRAPKTSFGQAISKAHQAAQDTEDAERREMDEALDDKPSDADK